ncbi:MAG: PD40 domain-containing protein [Gammaproteobacteria bacterium]|nr:PD40 domain-containing protein [Gammaproteobacteria bacterium]MBU6510383.1 PD40 domain-containing protein [Gammaproteobacteria bacterium]
MRSVIVALLLALLSVTAVAANSPPLLLQTPTLSQTRIAFAYGDEIWIAPRAGGDAGVLAGGNGLASGPVFSPDGSLVAYTGNYTGNQNVYVVPAAGGEPRRLTWHPGADVVVGWTPDGKHVLFRSHRDGNTDSDRLFTVPVTGGLPTVLPLSMAEDGSYSPDALHLAYSPIFQWEPDWKGYRGGQTTPIWIARLSDSSVAKIPRNNSNDRDPMWVGNTVYFLSDRDGPVTLFAYDSHTGQVTKLLNNDGFDIDSASAGPGAIVYSQMGRMYLFDLATHASTPVNLRVAGDMPQLAPHFVKVAKEILNAGISPTGMRAVFEAHGDILTVPADKGDIRDITSTPGAAERDPSWSPDGKSIAYFSDASGEYQLYIRDQEGLKPPRVINLGNPPSFFYSPVWSPDSKKIAYSDKRLNLWYVDLDHPLPVKVDTDLFDTPLHEFDQSWSPDGKWLAYTKQLPNHLRAVFVYSLASGKATQVTDGMSDCLYPVWDKNGKYLYFTASTDMGLTAGWLDMTSEAHPVTRSVYVAVLRRDLPSPIAPLSDDEKAAEPSQPADDKHPEKTAETPVSVSIDFDGLLQRTLALPIAPGNYVGLSAGAPGVLYLQQAPLVFLGNGPMPTNVQKFDLKDRKTTPLLSGVNGFALSFNGEKMLYQIKDAWFIAKADAPPKPGDGRLNTANLQVWVVPRAEWNQMYREVWRIERDFFYDPHYHGLDIAAAQQRFAVYLPGIASRDDLNFLFRKMLSYMSVGHMFVRGGAEPEMPKENIGLLGTDYTVEHGRYRFSKIYSGENWNPQLQAPLTQPGVNVKAGEYLLAVNGRALTASDNLYSYFVGSAGQQTVLRVGPSPDGSGARDVTVVPVTDEFPLRNLDWVEGNRRLVDKLSGGKLAYVHLPDTARGGFTSFNRYYFAQTDKLGAVLDERYNHGGQLADYIVDYLMRRPMSRVATREGRDYTEPTQAIFGPKAMIINQFSGSGGDAMPWYFKRMAIGPLIGERTWGGLVGIGGYPVLMDGGRITAPRWAIYGLHGHWEVENHGIAPNIEVWQDPKLVREGHDPQLEKTVEVLMQQLKAHPAPLFPRPPYPNHHPQLPPIH